MRKGVAPEESARQPTAFLQKAQVFLRIGLSRNWEKHPDRFFVQITGVHTYPDYLRGRCFADLALTRQELLDAEEMLQPEQTRDSPNFDEMSIE